MITRHSYIAFTQAQFWDCYAVSPYVNTDHWKDEKRKPTTIFGSWCEKHSFWKIYENTKNVIDIVCIEKKVDKTMGDDELAQYWFSHEQTQ